MSFESERCFKIHAGKTHKKIILASPEKERSVSVQDISLVMSPSFEPRDNEESAHNNPEKKDVLGTFKCDYCKNPSGNLFLKLEIENVQVHVIL